jgi:catechol 2,3-dioxygenase-like lactoylglutathione lyase family enzyme
MSMTTADTESGGWRPIHIATMLVVADLDRSAAFYRDRLGFEIREQQPGLILLASGEMLLYLIAHSEPTPDKPGVTLTGTNESDRTSVNLVFRVVDCRAAHDELTRRGVVFLTAPRQPPWGGWRCFARDPDDYLIEIEQP